MDCFVVMLREAKALGGDTPLNLECAWKLLYKCLCSWLDATSILLYPFGGYFQVSDVLRVVDVAMDCFVVALREAKALGGDTPLYLEYSARLVINPERDLEQNGPPLGLCEAEGVAANEGPTWNWRENPGSGENESAYNGRVISVKWGESTKRIGIDGSSKAINEAISSAFGQRTKRTFWLEAENGDVNSLGRDMPLWNYHLHLDKGLTIKISLYNEPNNKIAEVKTSTMKKISAVFSTIVDGLV